MISVPDKSALSLCARLVHLPAHVQRNLNKHFCWACAWGQRWYLPFFQMFTEVLSANFDLILGRKSGQANRDWFCHTEHLIFLSSIRACSLPD